MTVFSPTVLEHLRAHAPALGNGAIDYDRLLREDLPQIDFFDHRDHVATIAGSALAEGVRRRAGGLKARDVSPGDRVVMVASNSVDYLCTLLAVLRLGAVPCAIAPPPTPSRLESAGVRHLAAAIDVVDPVLVVADPRVAVAVGHSGLVTYDELAEAPPISWHRDSPVDPDDVHHIQLTSGSTSAPKAVVLSHGNVAHNIGVLAHEMGANRGVDRVFSWLPMYHDMGFVQVLGALLYGLPLGLMSPLAFLRDPLCWLRHMTRHRSTVTAGPTFAYRAATDSLDRFSAEPALDLSALRHAFVGAEPIPYPTLQRFSEAFTPFGLTADTVVPCYGMAESVLATTLARRRAPEGPLDFGRVRALPPEHPDPPLVSCGSPIDGLKIRIVDSNGVAARPGAVGEIQVSGPSVMQGYRCRDGSLSDPPGGWHHTGDIGFLSDGELFVVGRSKEMLILRGRNLPPYDVERVIEAMPEAQPGYTVVFAAPDQRDGSEVVVAVVGTPRAVADPGALRSAVATRVRQSFGFSLDDVVLVPRRRVPRTTSGKIQRLKVRELYLAGRL